MKKYFSFLLVAVLFAACTPNNEVGTPFKAGQKVTLTAHMPNAGNNGAQKLPGKQRVHGDDTHKDYEDEGTINLYWNEGDQIKVTVGGKSQDFTLLSGAGTANATFEGTMPADGTTYNVQYPVEEPNLSEQEFMTGGFRNGLMKMSGTGTVDGGFTLKAEHALLGLQFKFPPKDEETRNTQLSKVVLTNLDNNDTYTLKLGTSTDVEDLGENFYFVVPAGEWEKGFKVDIYLADGNTILETITKYGPVTFSAENALVMEGKNISKFYGNFGDFSVSADKKVAFAPGNLQFNATQGTHEREDGQTVNGSWRFAENQWDYIGADNENISDTYDGWIDLFGWGTANNPTNVSTNAGDYSSFTDWGENQIRFDASGAWRTLTKDEWVYLFCGRTNATSLFAFGIVEGVKGVILLPDEWSLPMGATLKTAAEQGLAIPEQDDYHTYQVDEDLFDSSNENANVYTAEAWSVLEKARAVFLPVGGCRYGFGYQDERIAYYWSSSEYNTTQSYSLTFSSNYSSWGGTYTSSLDPINDAISRVRGMSVRLVKDVN